MANQKEFKLSVLQVKALWSVYNRDTSVAEDFGKFLDTVEPALCMTCVMVPWKGMHLGIELDGYTHS